MRGRIYIPDEVRASIQGHIQDAVSHAQAEFLSASEDEDALTGHFGALLQTRGDVIVPIPRGEIPGNWKWRITYTKFRGRGPGATENIVGADGIVALTLDWAGQQQKKALLFQAKMGDSGSADVIEQVLKVRRELSWRVMAGDIVAIKFSLPHRIAVKVKPPAPRRGRYVNRHVPLEQVHEARMKATPEEILAAVGERPGSRLAKARNEVLRLYHPDKFDIFADPLRDIANRRTQEVNLAYEILKAEREKT